MSHTESAAVIEAKIQRCITKGNGMVEDRVNEHTLKKRPMTMEAGVTFIRVKEKVEKFSIT
ncbi:MAG: hypothetical protein ACP5ON_03795 [Bacteroidota bacterium]